MENPSSLKDLCSWKLFALLKSSRTDAWWIELIKYVCNIYTTDAKRILFSNGWQDFKKLYTLLSFASIRAVGLGLNQIWLKLFKLTEKKMQTWKVCTDGQTTDNRQSEKLTSCWLIRSKGLTDWNFKKIKLRLQETTFIAGTLTKSTMNTLLRPLPLSLTLSLSLSLSDTPKICIILTMTWHKSFKLTCVLLWVTTMSSKCFLQCFVFFHKPFSQPKFFCKGIQSMFF